MRVFRFAPSPNGFLHLGHARSALVNQRLAAECGGRMLLRLEDIDTARCTPALEAAVLEDLRWIGFRWDEPPRRQSEHFAFYRDALARLQTRGLVRPGYMSRAELRRHADSRPGWPRDPDGAPFAPLEDRADNGRPPVWRLDMDRAARIAGALEWTEEGAPRTGDPRVWGDPVLARRDVPTSYHLAVVTDDAAQGVTDVVRGRDLEPATVLHVLLQRLLDLPTPRYVHHDLVLGPDGRKLSKSDGATALRALRENGMSADEVCRLALTP